MMTQLRQAWVDTEKTHKAQVAVDLRVQHLAQDMFDKGEGEDSRGHSGHKGGYNDGVGLGRSPAIRRGSPHFQAAQTAVIDALFGLGRGGRGAPARGLCDHEKTDAAFLLFGVLLPKAAAD